ncbi:bacteriohopanetetrol glucosamine biosynthesis glycosyltransferase HpnI [Granulicella mallensis]|uniref:Ceramide glucosyltransferase n=1 Tax=Granulicella mallensis TaxID=940614 RepID=A0A7W7ZUF7_9BACT|nr:bacteriohopanetetrol glucosamine biosynthesis glycosyltransferase HpnI [Granulicella mallensis]MBB5065967.1 ceramide glucosyltransferase [Granulicella mallensis]
MTIDSLSTLYPLLSTLSVVVEVIAALLTASGIAYGLLALLGARAFEHDARAAAKLDAEGFAPGVSVLKPVKGVDSRMYAGFVSHCVQQYAGEFELLFGISSLDDPAVAEIARLRIEYPQLNIRLVECPERLGSNGKVSNLAQMLPHASFEHIVVNDSDILVSPRYLSRVLAPFAQEKTGLVTVPYVGQAEGTLWSRLEALGISTDFMAGVLTARKLEGGIHFGLGSTLATTKTALAAIGGFEALVEQLADDYEMGVRLSRAGYRVELVHEVVATTVPAYTLRGFCEHQLRWSRSTRDSRRAGYIGLGVTYVLPWSLAAVLASGGSLWSFSLFSLALLVRVAVALTVGVGILRDGQVLRDLILLPLRDCFGLFFWAWSYASDVVVWRGEHFRLKRGRLERV